MDAVGRPQEAEALLSDVMSATGAYEDLSGLRMEALVLLAERTLRAGDARAAALAAREAIDQLPRDPAGWHDATLSSAWQVLARAELVRGDVTAAGEAVAALTDADSVHDDLRGWRPARALDRRDLLTEVVP